MTTSIRNARSAIAVLERAIQSFRDTHGAPPVARIEWHLATLLVSVKKCLAGLAAELELYQSAKGTGRAYWITQPDGSRDHVCGQQLESLCLPLADGEAAVIHGKPEALAAVAAALNAAGRTPIGPAPLHDIARQLSEAAFHAAPARDTAPPEPEKESAHGKP
ncbi:hypothetical protein [Roseibium sediminicola]|uniref:Uncharacterized protein n=1 Tax=Roseibium sediminicola TaxID=2933272 RepID=A0ABT0H2A6_9HYPH|nr:hypothetical protein [Roseibium sp. CAU 1639]MCK7615220.1 hypothetical protein [Roseibium sp. CAU 1639]